MTQASISLTRDEILAVYAQGPEAVVALVTMLLGRLATVEAAHAVLAARLTALEARLAKDSHNSSAPPSRDPVRVPKSLREPSGRPPGGVPGHRGQTLECSATPDEIAMHAAACCAHCGEALRAPMAQDVVERRQVVDLPTPPAGTPPRPLVPLVTTEHRVADVQCSHCGTWTRGTFPPAARTTVQYGPRLAALGTYLTTGQLLPPRRAAHVLACLTGQSLSAATLLAVAARGAAALASTDAALRSVLTAAAVLHYDETGLVVDRVSHWLHVASTATHTHYTVDRARGRQGAERAGILPAYRGTLVHDSASGYQQYTACTHALCGAHLLRELTFFAEQQAALAGRPEDQQAAWAAGLAQLLRQAKRTVAAARDRGAVALAPSTWARYRRRYAALLAAGEVAHPPPAPTGRAGHPKRTPAGNLLYRLRRDADAVWRFATDFGVPFDNNQAERDLRMMKLKQKISGGFRMPGGAETFCRLRSYLSTAQKQGHDWFAALVALYEGRPLAVART